MLLGAVFLALIWFGSAEVVLAVALGVGALAFHECAELLRSAGLPMARVPALLATLAVTALVPFPAVALSGVMGLGLIAAAIAVMARVKTGDLNELRESVARVLAAAFPMVYLGLPLGALVGIHAMGGRSAVLLLIGTVVASDTAQYYTGRLLGRRPLSPRLSPKKTIEGAAGGFVAAPALLALAGPGVIPAAGPLMLAALGVVLVACGIAGDLFESMIKRAAEQKDSSALIPGHGGVLDRIDALLFATPPFYLVVRWAYTV